MIQKSNKSKEQSGANPPKSRDKKNPIQKSSGHNPLQNGLQMDEMGFKQFLEAIPDGLAIVNAQGKIQFVNNQVERLFGYQAEEMLGKPIELLIPDRFSAHKEHREGYLDNLHTRPMGSGLALFAARKDGTEFQADISLSFLKIGEETYIIAAIRDVTVQRLSEKQLKKSLERYQQTLNNMLEGCQIIDFDWRYIYLNDAAASQGHNRAENMLMRTMMDVYPGIEKTELFSNLRRCMEERTPHKMENKFDYPDGTTGWFDLSIEPVPEGIFILSVDITKRKEAESALKGAEGKFRTLVEQLPAITYIVKFGENALPSFISPQIKSILGFSAEEWLADPNLWENQLHPDDRDHVLTEFATRDSLSQPIDMDYRILTRTGDVRWIHDQSRLILDENNHPLYAHGLMFDISDRKQAEAALLESGAQFRTLFEASPDAIILIDPHNNWTIFDCNTAACQMNGYTRDELIGQSIDLLNLESAPVAERMEYLEQIRRAGILHLETFHRHKDGSVFSVEVSTSLIMLGGREMVLGIDRDISERKQAEALLVKSEMRFRALVEKSMEEVSLVGADGTLLFESPTTRRPLGYPPNALVGYNLFELFHPDDRAGAAKLLEQVIRQPGAHQEAQFRLQHQDGSWRWMEGTITNMLDESAVQAVVVNYRDVTERKQVEEALEQSEKRFRSLIENSADAITLLDPDGVTLYDSPAAPGMLGYEQNELIGQNVFSLIHADDLPSVRQLFGKLIEIPGKRINSVFRFQHKNGSWRWIEAAAANLLAEPSVKAIVVNYRDITERTQAEEAKLAAESKYRSIFENSVEGIYQSSPDGKFITANPTLARMFGYDSPEQLISKLSDINNQFYVKPGRREEFIQQLERGGIYADFESEAYQKDGSTLWIAENGRAVHDNDGNLLYYEGIIENITSRKQSEAALIQSEERYRSLFEDSPISLWEEDFSAVKQRIEGLRQQGITDFRAYFSSHPQAVIECAALIRVMDVNKAALKLYRTQSKEDLISNLTEVIEPEMLSHFQEELLCVAEGRTQYNWEGPEKTLTGERIDVRINWIAAPGHEEKLSKVIVSIIDLTERRQAEEEIRTRTNELQTLYKLSRALADADDLDEILNQVNRHAVGSVHTTFARIALLEGNHFVIRAAHPVRILDHDLLVGKREPLVMLPYCKHVLEQNKPVVLHKNSPEVSSYERAALLLDFAQSLCLIPLQVGRRGFGLKQVLGILILGETRSEGREPFTPAKILLSESIGDQAASAIRRMLLYKQTQRRFQHLSALREIDQAIASSFGLDLSLRAVLSQVTEQLSVDAACIWLFNPASNMLEYSAGRGFQSKVFEQAKPLRLGEGYAGRAALERCTIHISELAAQEDNPRLMKALANEPFASYYGVPLIAKGSIKGVLEVFHRIPLEPDEEWLEFLDTLAGQAAIAIDNATLFENLQSSNTDLMEAYDTTLEGWSAALDLRDKETEGHTQRVTRMTLKLAESMGFKQQQLVQVRRGALLHDIGKMGVPDRILLKPDKLTDEEWVVMRRHPVYAYELLKGIAYLHDALDIPYCHHEKWDGTGYPRGMTGEEIPLAARIFAVIDIYDALTSDRPYRQGWTRERTLNHIRDLSGTHLDPQVVEAFLKMISKDE